MFFTPRYLKHAQELRIAARKLFHYHCDLWKAEQQKAARAALQQLDQALKQKEITLVTAAQEKVEKLFGQLIPERPHRTLAENVEAIIIAIVLALGIQAYFLKPFKIPTCSMLPTLYGMTGMPEMTTPPSPLWRVIDFVRLGRSYLSTTANQEEEVLDLKEKTYLNFFTFTTITTSQGTHTIFAPQDVLMRDFEVRPGRIYAAGEPIVRGYIQAGDQIFCDRFTYAFRKPRAADVFVFITTGIQRIEMTLPAGASSQYYVKRLAGLPGQTLRIDPPQLFINEERATQPPFQRVMAACEGYRGYSNRCDYGPSPSYLSSPLDQFTVPPRSFFALGDNSFNSSDSRYWGVVPEQNVIGRALFVYWPFSKRWGLIH
ncbi:MAG: signal peptidase I [Chthoniobacterales bacterium]|nr:signal peptidase I [Chthoniobacterales bacterium]